LANEAHKFLILKDKESFEVDSEIKVGGKSFTHKKKVHEHRCKQFGPFNKGAIQNMSNTPLHRLDISDVEDFIGRR
jgi:hypothetical protein